MVAEAGGFEPGERERLVRRIAREVADLIWRHSVVDAGDDAMFWKSELVSALAKYFENAGVEPERFKAACYGDEEAWMEPESNES